MFTVWCVVDSISDRKSTRLNSSHVRSSYAVFCLKKKMSGSKQLMQAIGLGCLRGAPGEEQSEWMLMQASHQIAQEVERGGICPLYIVDEEDAGGSILFGVE